MKRTFRNGYAFCLVAWGAGWMASGMTYAQAPRQPQVPAGVVSEEAEDAAIGRRNLRAGTNNQVAPPRPTGGTTPAVAPTSTAVATPQGPAATASVSAVPATVAASASPAAGPTLVAGGPTAAVGTTQHLPADLRAADFGLWLQNAGGVLRIADLATTGPIASLGLQPGDTIASVNGVPVQTEQEFLKQVLNDSVRNQQVNVVVARGGLSQLIQVQPSNLLQGMVMADPLFHAGLVLDPSQPGKLVVQQVAPRTPAYYAGLRAGDVITSVGGQPVTGAQTLGQSLAVRSTGLNVEVNRGGQARGLTFVPATSLFNQGVTASGQTSGMFNTTAAVPFGTTNNTAATAGNPANGTTGVASSTAIAPAAPVGTGARGGSLFPNISAPPPTAAVPGSTERVPVTIPGASTPAAGNPIAPGAPPATTTGTPNASGTGGPGAGGAGAAGSGGGAAGGGAAGGSGS